MNDWQDRIVDSALHELGGRTPPDLSARIVIALSEASSTSQLGDLPMLQETRRRWLPSILLAARAGKLTSANAMPRRRARARLRQVWRAAHMLPATQRARRKES